ncbi:MAG TPA: cysteine--tRNA ligase [Mizugakiibacter sp.]|nr:cysteine--tRNA ligase [Mizugakiibacter sp.]
MTLRLFNSLSHRLEIFEPQNPHRVTMYLCGPTVYHYVHIGNARPAVVFDLLVRLLRRTWPNLVFARNITDVDDKINAAATAQGESIQTLSQRYAEAYRVDIRKLGVAVPDVEPHATQHIDAIIRMIQRLLARGCAYAAEGHVLFEISHFPEYGRLSGRSPREMLAGARVEVAPYKKAPGDFVLWKPSSDDLPGWESPWGRGRPGWHIECSAMAAAHLGETIDIHAGGVDLQFPHHENEIAQSTCAHGGKPFARFWLHNGMLTFGGRKMSKSLGNVRLLHDLLQQYPPEVLRLMLIKAHYRQPLEWSNETLAQARATLDGWYGLLRDLGRPEPSSKPLHPAFLTALEDDLNTPAALAELAQLADTARREPGGEALTNFVKSAQFLGLLQQDPEQWFKHGVENLNLDTAHIERLLAERSEARQRRDFARADSIRDELAQKGIAIEDNAQGTRWKIAES